VPDARCRGLRALRPYQRPDDTPSAAVWIRMCFQDKIHMCVCFQDKINMPPVQDYDACCLILLHRVTQATLSCPICHHIIELHELDQCKARSRRALTSTAAGGRDATSPPGAGAGEPRARARAGRAGCGLAAGCVSRRAPRGIQGRARATSPARERGRVFSFSRERTGTRNT
jgi:hypothetical protein